MHFRTSAAEAQARLSAIQLAEAQGMLQSAEEQAQALREVCVARCARTYQPSPHLHHRSALPGTCLFYLGRTRGVHAAPTPCWPWLLPSFTRNRPSVGGVSAAGCPCLSLCSPVLRKRSAPLR